MSKNINTKNPPLEFRPIFLLTFFSVIFGLVFIITIMISLTLIIVLLLSLMFSIILAYLPYKWELKAIIDNQDKIFERKYFVPRTIYWGHPDAKKSSLYALAIVIFFYLLLIYVTFYVTFENSENYFTVIFFLVLSILFFMFLWGFFPRYFAYKKFKENIN